MGTGRMEAFSDGVIAIIITIMVLELKVPHGTDLAALGDRLPELANYVLSVVYVAIYRNNHHHLLHACERINGAIMWGNGRESFPSWTSPVRPRSPALFAYRDDFRPSSGRRAGSARTARWAPTRR